MLSAAPLTSCTRFKLAGKLREPSPRGDSVPGMTEPVKPCRKCGSTERGKPTKRNRLGNCKPCRRALMRAWFASHERDTARAAEWRATPKGIAVQRASRYRNKYDGLTLEQYDAIRCYQVGVCVWCGKPLPIDWHGRETHIDHAENGGRIVVRGLVHGTCNSIEIRTVDALIARHGIERGCPAAVRAYFTDPPAQRVLAALRATA